jgi:hypothetical protein
LNSTVIALVVAATAEEAERIQFSRTHALAMMMIRKSRAETK